MTNRTAVGGADRQIEPGNGSGSRWGLAGLCLSMLLSSLDTSIANVALPTLANDFSASFAAVQWVVLAYLLAVTSFLVGLGRLGDVFGRRRLLAAGVLLFTATSVLCATAPSLEVLVAARALQGLGGAAMIAHTMALASATAKPGRTGSAMGLLGTMSAVGTALGPSLGGALLAVAGWRALFWINLPLGLLALLLLARGLPRESRRRAPARAAVDAPGTLLLALSLAAYALAMSEARAASAAAAWPWALLAGLGAVLFLQVERRAPAPLLRLSMFRDADLGTGLGMSLLVSTVIMTTLVVGPFHLARSLGLGPTAVGAVMSVGPAMAALSGWPAGRLVDRLGAQPTTLLGLAAMACGSLLLALLPESLGAVGYALPLAVVTAGYAVFQAANNTAVLAGAGAERRGLVAGMLSLSRNLGLVTGVVAMGAVFEAAGGSDVAHAAPAAVAHGMRATFATSLLLLAVAVGLALARGRSLRRPRGEAAAAGQTVPS